MRMKTIVSGAVLSVLSVVSIGGFAYAALSDSTLFSQQINAGTLSTFIGDGTGAEVVSPNVTFSSLNVSNATQTSTGTYGTNTERIYVDNPDGADNGWTLSLAATGGPTATWSDGGTNTYAFNAAASANGQLTLNPSVGTLTAVSGTTTGITKGASATFSVGSPSIELLNAAAGADDVGRVYLTGVTASQTVPAMTPSGSYTIDFTQTVVANP